MKETAWSRQVFALTLLAGCGLVLQSCAPLAIGSGVTAGAVASDKRTTGSLVEDQVIEAKTSLILADEIGESAEIEVTSFNRIVLLTGQSPTRELRNQAQELVEGIENVREIHNRITIANPASVTQGLSDSAVTSKVKLALLGVQRGDFSGLQIKVVTELGVVYLMGIVTEEHGAIAVDTAREVSGVLNIVKLFEYKDS